MRRLVPLALVPLVLFVVLSGPAAAGSLEDGRKALEKEDWVAAADSFRDALTADATSADAAIGLARAALGGQMADAYFEAESAVQTALEQHPERRDARHALGDLFLARAKTRGSDPQAMKLILEDAKTTFQDLLGEDATDELAAVGLARAYYESADFDGAVALLDTFLGEHESTGPAWFWKGQALYLKGLDAYRASGQIDEAAKDAFRKAQGAYVAATKADPKHFDGWMQLGYAAQYIGETDEAQKAYEKAMSLDPQSLLPLKGIAALYHYRQEEYSAAIAALAKAHPKNVAVLYYLGYRHLQDERYDDAVKSLQAFASKADAPGLAWVQLGKAYEGKGDTSTAREHYEKALDFNPNDLVAADAVDRELRSRYGSGAANSPKAALDLVKAYEDLFQRAPANVWVRNNVAFILREAVTPRQNEEAWRPVLDACTKVYDDASALAEQQLYGNETSAPYTTRHGYAGVLNDTGLMYQYYPAILNLEKAEDHYLRALELTEDGYRDAFTNLEKIYVQQERWDDLYELAQSCAESLKEVSGQPDATGRAYARGVAQKLVQQGKVEK